MPTLIPVHLEVEAEALGPVLLLLNGVPGVHGIAPNLDAAGKKPKRNGSNGAEHTPRPRSGINVSAIIIRELMSGQKNLQHLKDTVEKEGGAALSVSSALHTLSKKGVTSIVSAGVHALTEEAMERINAEQQRDAPPQLPAPKRGDSRPFVLKSVEQGMTRLEMTKAGQQIGIGERMIDGALTRLKAEKAIHAIGPGQFKLGPPPSKSKKK